MEMPCNNYLAVSPRQDRTNYNNLPWERKFSYMYRGKNVSRRGEIKLSYRSKICTKSMSFFKFLYRVQKTFKRKLTIRSVCVCGER